MSTVSGVECAHLDYTFRKDKYARVRINSEESLEYVIFIHDILYEVDDSENPQSFHLLATKYSFLRSAHLFQTLESLRDHEVVISSRELLLHFENFNKMGKPDDAEVIRIDDIAYAGHLTSGSDISSDFVEYTVQPPAGGNNLDRS
jgi:hypothetical protein